ncbi:hypothetical protein IPC367_27225 [Pseudomonas aeruginosa]|uniref:hypothetical protein n=1 Tax=Pseudomonas aeruginosa TaxID=287 RepID=UPI000FD554F0|nr:hypothetical protein [Pseudomonas aeruginosa]RUJ22080.1 hypothetical protein IPC367_27225 [Pseudomonas aeruginosa]
MSEVKRYHFESFIDSYYKHRQFVLASDYDTLAAEAQALREEVAQQKFLTKVENDALKMMTDKANELKSEVEQLEEELESLRARVVVVPERLTNGDSISRMLREIGCDGDVSYHHAREIWNACLDELARLNGKTVSEGLLRRIAAPVNNQDELDAVHEARIELRALLNQGKENGDHAA